MRWDGWAGEPERCTCTSAIAADLGETLACPRGWWPLPRGGWAHAPWWAR